MPEHEVFTQKRYRCPICRRSWSKRSVAVAHVADCPKDPERHGCLTCRNYDPGYEACYPEHPGQGPQCAKEYVEFDLIVLDPRKVRDCSGWNSDVPALKAAPAPEQRFPIGHVFRGPIDVEVW